MEHITLVVQQAGAARTESLMGREFRVFPAVLVREQVLHNNLGRTFLPADEIAASVDAWNGIPVVIRHPQSRGAPVSARSPEILNARGAGFLFRARYEDAALKADVFLDMERAAALPDTGDMIANVEAGHLGELSTGFGTNAQKAPGAFGGRAYDVVLRDIRPDHLALLPDEVGACSVADGCGLGVNAEAEARVDVENAGPPDVEAVVDTPAWRRFVAAAAQFLGIARDAGDAPGDEAGDNEPVANAGDQSQEGDDMDRKTLIAQLVAAGPLDEEALNKLSDCQLKALAAPTAANAEPQGDGWDKAREWRQKFETLQAQTANAVATEDQERARLLDDLLFSVNALPYTEAEIKAKDIVELRKMHKLAFPQRVDYSGRGGPRATNTAATFEVRGIMDGPAGSSVLDGKGAN